MPRGAGRAHNYRKVPTLTPLNDAQLPELPPNTRAALGARLLEDIRLDSIRAHRRRAEEFIAQVRAGRIPAKDGLAAINMLKVSAELLMVEKIMQAQGQTDDAPEHPLGIDGGIHVDHERVSSAPQIIHERKSGVDGKGNAINETTTTIIGGPATAETLPGVALRLEDESEEDEETSGTDLSFLDR
jgi:hypothetical protein